MLQTEQENVDFDGSYVFCIEDENKKVSLEEIGLKSTFFNNIELQVVKQHSSPLSPPPFMVGMVEVEVDKETGNIDVLDYVAVVDCGTPINPNLARSADRGRYRTGIGMALFEDVQYTDKGKIRNNSFMQYKIPSRMDIGKIRVDFESSYEESGPFGRNPLESLSLIPRVRHSQKQSIMQQESVYVNFRSLRRRSRWGSLKKRWRNKYGNGNEGNPGCFLAYPCTGCSGKTAVCQKTAAPSD